MPFKLLAPPGRARGLVAVGDGALDHDDTATTGELRQHGALDFAPAVLDDAHIGDIEGSASSTGRCNGPAMMAGRTRADDRWRAQHARQRTQRAGT